MKRFHVNDKILDFRSSLKYGKACIKHDELQSFLLLGDFLNETSGAINKRNFLIVYNGTCQL